jgi:hypothetical protein
MDSNNDAGGTAPAESHPQCFGDPERVCPKDEKGFFHPQEQCLPCNFLKPCLRAAMEKQNLLPPPSTGAQVSAGLVTFFKRWSAQKLKQ